MIITALIIRGSNWTGEKDGDEITDTGNRGGRDEEGERERGEGEWEMKRKGGRERGRRERDS